MENGNPRKESSQLEAEIRRYRQKEIAAAAVLALAVLFILWYLWPRSWESTAGTFEPERIAGKAVWMDLSPTNISYTLEEIPGDEPAAQEIMRVLTDHSYRSELSNLLNGTPFQRDGAGTSGPGPIDLYFSWQEPSGGNALTVTIFNNGLVWLNGNVRAFYRSDSGLYQEIADLFRNYGSPY